MLPTLIKENPLKSLAAFLGSVSVILTSLAGLDSRYAHADEVQKYQSQVQSQMLEYRYQDLDNKVFEMELRKGSAAKSWTPTDEAVLERYRRQLDGANRLRSQQAPVDKSRLLGN